MACLDKNVELDHCDTEINVRAENWSAKYVFNANSVNITLLCKDGIYNIPIVCRKDSIVTASEDNKAVSIDHRLILKADVSLMVDCDRRVFNQVGGLLYLPISVKVQGEAHLAITIL